MGIFSKIAKTAIRTVQLPVSAVKDAVTLGGVLTDEDEAYTKTNAEKLLEALDELDDEIDDL